jgi:processive 1,2-diacylglycerol beta-glucosyltransferase
VSLKVMILSSSTGGGHDMRAQALTAWAERNTDWKVSTHQALEATHGLYAFGVGFYNAIQRTLPVAHHVYYQFLERANMHRHGHRILGRERFQEHIEEFAPDLVVSTHDQLNHGFFDLARAQLGPSRVACVTYCGELWGGYGFSRQWVNPAADGFIAAVEPCREAALRLGMPKERAVTGGFLLRPEFFQAPAPEDSREAFLGEELGLDPQGFTILLATGAVGANNHIALLRAMESRRRPIQAVALCGAQASSLQAVRNWGSKARYVEVQALGRREDMSRIVRNVDLLVARPGSGTTSEAMRCGTPLVFNGIGGVMPQEYITVKFARHHGFASVIHWPRQLARTLDGLTDEPERLAEMREQALNACPNRHPDDILRRLQEIADARGSDAPSWKFAE